MLTDGSVENPVNNGGSGIIIQQQNNMDNEIIESVATGTLYTSYDADAIMACLEMLRNTNSRNIKEKRIVVIATINSKITRRIIPTR